MSWQQRVGSQRDWVWRGWQIRYTYFRPVLEVPSALQQRKLSQSLSQSISQTISPTIPVMLLHGFGGSIGHWRYNLPVLGKYHGVYALDLLGFGASRKVWTDYNINLWVDQVYDFWRTFIGVPMVLVGNSLGSLVSLTAAATYPEMVGGLALINLPDLEMSEEAIPALLRPIVSRIEGTVASFASPILFKAIFALVIRPSLVGKFARIAYANPEVITDELVDIFTEPALDAGAETALSALVKGKTSRKFGRSVKSILPQLEIPLLLIWGLQDRVIPPQLARKFVAMNPKLELVEIENAGHCPHDECPERVNQILLDWIGTRCFPQQNFKSSSLPS
ncbi:MAG TPA: alpha/beta hydrolase [Cyanobacteria bacterium UBA11149]|nr:alpha/beta hydrolase [Cyanobacteria bacterium UBA11367]HBE60816.1 alpha/beta hydrolase [Cyanobacteria bacterium UBA11366]HBK63439.1 alpha/beta hydrolase [Cyanobacteria bacterium UBA11166]HBR74404.1 alpha/beta hydrolase [Cyanobacteria bacterium UBA11159]HBS68672.1 alpha/beta hydrolase [Cyanobacteria bacterium UBA11153]HBW89812.1 alpha/beta hydrolase [Cyanobacteria bacterium UBA11149]HCA94610.1 alpha/beta hydrolase [Cyanobacteria bacterium UBA9226]